jgi:multiple sugar transport system permease protein
VTDAAVLETSKRKSRPRNRWRATGWKFAAPGLSLIAIVVGIPLVYAVLLSFSSFTLLNPTLEPFIGLENFRSVLTDESFWHSVWLTIQYSAATVIGQFLLGLGIALLLHRVVRAKAIYFAVLTVPIALSPVSTGLIWQMLLQADVGIVNRLLDLAGSGRVDWLGDPELAFGTVATVAIWHQVSLVVLVLAAGLASLPKAPYEAAEADGAGKLQRFWYLTLPMLRPAAAIAIVIQLINEVRTFDLVYVLTRGGPGDVTDLLSTFAYRRAFLGLSISEGSVVSFVLLMMVLILTVVLFRLVTRRR